MPLGGAAAVAGLSGTVDFEKEILLSLHAAGTISDSELARREQEVRGCDSSLTCNLVLNKIARL